MSAENTNAGGGERSLIERARLAAASEHTMYGGTAGELYSALADALSAQSTGSAGVAAEPVAWAYDMILRGIPNGVIATPQVSFTYPNSRIEFISNIRPLYEHPLGHRGEDADDLNGAPRKAPLVLPDEDAAELAASERISATQVAYDRTLGDCDPTEPEHEVRLFDAMKEAIAAADAIALASPPTAVGGEGVLYQYREIGEGEGWQNCAKDFYDHLQRDPNMDTRTVLAPLSQALADENTRLRAALGRARDILGNMALEHETGWRSVFARWPIHHEPLRSDARAVLPIINAVLENCS